MTAQRRKPLYRRIREILELTRASAARSVNIAQVMSNWLIGREIVEEEQQGKRRASYGEGLLRGLAERLQSDYGSGYSLANVKFFRKFYLEYPRLGDGPKGYALRSLLPSAPGASEKGYAPRSQSRQELIWKPGRLHPNLSWTHYRTLLRVDEAKPRSFYEIEATRNNWSARELERQMSSLLYERLAMSRNKKELARLAAKGHEVQKPSDVFKDPVVMEFLGLPKFAKLAESTLEQALIDNLQAFLLELGKGFAFVSRQERITLEGDHFYIDLVFYHTILKCHILIDLKVGKLTHQDLGQLQLYVNYYDRERRTAGDNPTLGLILCTDKNDAVVKYTLAEDQQQKIFAGRYKLHLPTEAALKAEIRRELKVLRREEINS